MVELAEIVDYFAKGMMVVDARHPVAINVRSKKPYQAVLGQRL